MTDYYTIILIKIINIKFWQTQKSQKYMLLAFWMEGAISGFRRLRHFGCWRVILAHPSWSGECSQVTIDG